MEKAKPPIERATEADAAGILDIYGPLVERSTITFETERPSREEMGRRIREVGGSYPWLVWREDGRVVGYAYASNHRARAAYRWATEVSVYVAADRQRSGIARALYSKLLEILRAQRFELALAGITLPNEPSVRLHESLGFEPVGIYRNIGFKQGAWRDVGWWSYSIRKSPSLPPCEPLDLNQALAIVRLAQGG
jgi:L-amino acid N-acyltransferase YncA